MAATYADLIEECLSYLTSFGATRDKVTTLTGPIGTGDVNLLVDDARQVDRGLIEIDDELLYVKLSDVSSGIVTVHPWGRGQRGTLAASHSAGTMITNNPFVPRSVVKREIREVIDKLYPDLFAVAVDETQRTAPTQVTYPLPAVAQSIISVQYENVGPSKMWVPVTRYRMDTSADATAFPTGKSLDIYQPMLPGRTLKVRYRTGFGDLVAETDTLQSVGVEDSFRDIVRLGVVGRLLMGLEPARYDSSTSEASQGGGSSQPQPPSAVGRQYLSLMQIRIQEERRRLLNQYPSTQVRMS